jgi:glyceraldehyde 3-phosphate dehydrogenase
MAVRVGINGFGRIGRAFMRAAVHDPGVEVVAVNDLGNLENLAYLLQYDSVYRQFPARVSVQNGELVVGAKHIKVFQEKEPGNIPWASVGADVVVESTGFFTEFAKAKAHLAAGAKRVVVSAPSRDSGEAGGGVTVLMGVNADKLAGAVLSSNASCTTNAASPLIAILDAGLGVDKAVLSTVHGYTASQSLVDGPSKKDLKEGRAAALNIVPTSTGAAVAVTQAYEALAGRFDGISLRVPVPAGYRRGVALTPGAPRVSPRR